jgi:hypothetical protein
MDKGVLLFVLPVAAALLLSGCALGVVPQKDYDELKQSCLDERLSLNSDLSTEKERALDASQRLSDCASANDMLEGKIALKDAEIMKLNEGNAVLAQAIQMAGEIAALDLLLQYYNDAFGPGGIANTYRLGRIDAQVKLLPSPSLASAWASVRSCSSSSQCDSSKAAFVNAVRARQAKLSEEIVGLIKAANSTS